MIPTSKWQPPRTEGMNYAPGQSYRSVVRIITGVVLAYRLASGSKMAQAPTPVMSCVYVVLRSPQWCHCAKICDARC